MGEFTNPYWCGWIMVLLVGNPVYTLSGGSELRYRSIHNNNIFLLLTLILVMFVSKIFLKTCAQIKQSDWFLKKPFTLIMKEPTTLYDY